jgi:hypothetical protein
VSTWRRTPAVVSHDRHLVTFPPATVPVPGAVQLRLGRQPHRPARARYRLAPGERGPRPRHCGQPRPAHLRRHLTSEREVRCGPPGFRRGRDIRGVPPRQPLREYRMQRRGHGRRLAQDVPAGMNRRADRWLPHPVAGDGDLSVRVADAVCHRCRRYSAEHAECEGQDENPAHRPGAGRPRGSAVRR